MKHGATLLLHSSGLLWCLSVAAAPQDIEAQLATRNVAAFQELAAEYQEAVAKVNQQFGIDYTALNGRYGSEYLEYLQKLSILERNPFEQTAKREKAALDAFFQQPKALRYLEARLFLENELGRDHLVRARRLQACEEILGALVESDPLLTHFFRSAAYQRRYGMLLTRLVWSLESGLAALTRPLDTYTMFTDRRRMPMLVTFTPAAFTSLAFLRSMLIHELNHVLLYKEPLSVSREVRSQAGHGAPAPLSKDPYAWTFMRKHGRTAGYQEYLVHEYYAFKAQLLTDNEATSVSQERLLPQDRQRIEHLYEWIFSQLSPENQVLVKRHPDPPLVTYLNTYLPELRSDSRAKGRK